jgi:hypothetical protein
MGAVVPGLCLLPSCHLAVVTRRHCCTRPPLALALAWVLLLVLLIVLVVALPTSIPPLVLVVALLLALRQWRRKSPTHHGQSSFVAVGLVRGLPLAHATEHTAPLPVGAIGMGMGCTLLAAPWLLVVLSLAPLLMVGMIIMDMDTCMVCAVRMVVGTVIASGSPPLPLPIAAHHPPPAVAVGPS